MKQDNYACLVEAVLGDRTGYFLHCMFIFYSFGVNVTYQIVIIKFFPGILEIFNMDTDTSEAFTTRVIYMAILNILLYPILYTKDITVLAHFNFLGCASAFYVIFVILVVRVPI